MFVNFVDKEIADKRWEKCKKCGCFMKLKTKLKNVVCPDNPPRW